MERACSDPWTLDIKSSMPVIVLGFAVQIRKEKVRT